MSPKQRNKGRSLRWGGAIFLVLSLHTALVRGESNGLEAFNHPTQEQIAALTAQADKADEPVLLGRAAWVLSKSQGIDDLVRAGKFLVRSADRGDSLSWKQLSVLAGREGFVEAVRKAADAKDPDAANLLGELYAHGWGVTKDAAKAMEWFTKSSEWGDAAAVRNLGVAYVTGRGVKKDASKGAEYFKKAAVAGDVAAMGALGVLSEKGWGMRKDLKAALAQYQKASDIGALDACVDLGRMYELGLGVEKNPVKAKEQYEMAAGKGNSEGARYLGALYETGTGLEKDGARAMMWYLKSAEGGDAEAAQAVKRLEQGGMAVSMGVKVSEPVVRFEYDKSDLTAEGMGVLDALAGYLSWGEGMSVKVDGYCDSRGAEKYNQKLSERRAETVREALRFYGVPDQKIVATGYASTHPVAPNDNEEDMAKNRRTELRTARF